MTTVYVKRYLTTYALSQGIEPVNVRFRPKGYARAETLTGRAHFVKQTDLFETVEGAQAEAREMRDRKVASLEKQIARLKAMTFDTVREG